MRSCELWLLTSKCMRTLCHRLLHLNIVWNCIYWRNHMFNVIFDIVNVRSHRIALIRLICSSHRLEIETGRWKRPITPRENRKCPICGKLGDEYHFLFECTVHTTERNKFIPKFYRTRPSMMKCVSLFNSTNKKEIRNLAKFVYKAFSIGTQS